jgi:thiamine-phosphate pyrophosphorylase
VTRHPLSLPPLLVLTDRTLCAPRPLVDVVQAAVDGGARAVILREKDLSRDERAALADELRPVLHGAGGLLLVASDPTIDADGVHLAAADPFPEPRPAIVGRSCHDLAEVRAAEAEGCDYVTFSPVAPSISKRGYRPLSTLARDRQPDQEPADDWHRYWDDVRAGIMRLNEASRGTRLPVYALGGIDRLTASHALKYGASGLAVLGSVMAADDPTGAVVDLLAQALDSVRGRLVRTLRSSTAPGRLADVDRFLVYKFRLDHDGCARVRVEARARRADVGARPPWTIDPSSTGIVHLFPPIDPGMVQ